MKNCLILLMVLVFSVSGYSQEKSKHIVWLGENDCVATFTEENKPQCDLIVADGQSVKIIRHGNLTVMANTFDDGDYFIADVMVLNDSADRVLADPANSRMAIWRTRDFANTTPEMFSPIEPERIAEKIKRRIAWANALGAFGAALAKTNANVSTTTPSGRVYQSTVTLPDSVAREAEAQRAIERNAKADSQGVNVIGNAFKANTLFSKQSENGFIYFKRNKKMKVGKFVIKIGDVYYNFYFNRAEK